MIIGLGIDILDVERFAIQLKRTPEFKQSIERQGGIDENVEDLASNFAILEALYKALPDNEKNQILDYKLSYESSGRRIVTYEGDTTEIHKNVAYHISVSHAKSIIVACVIIESPIGNQI